MNDPFPKLPPYRASYAPIYLEPIMGSGERIAVAVAAVGQDNQYKVIQALPEKIIECLYGSKKNQFSGLIKIIISSAADHLSKNQFLKYWEPPVSGAILGEITESYDKDIKGILTQALKMHSSLSQLPGAKEVIEDDDGTKKWWIEQVKEKLNNKNLIVNFEKKFSFYKNYKNIETRYDYAGKHYVANISRLPYGRNLSRYVSDAKVKLFDLESIKKFSTDNKTLFPDNNIAFELLLYTPPNFKQSPKTREAFYILEEAADDRELRVVSVETPSQVVERIQKKEAA